MFTGMTYWKQSATINRIWLSGTSQRERMADIMVFTTFSVRELVMKKLRVPAWFWPSFLVFLGPIVAELISKLWKN
jgi:hypothetical protein